MSYHRRIDSLTDNQKRDLRKYLTFYPTADPNSRYPAPKTPLYFYIVRDQEVILPMTFASGFFQCHPGLDIQYPCCELLFQGKLLETQHPVARVALNYLIQYGAAILGLPTGFGKTVIAIWLAAQLRLPIAILMHRESLLTQWYTTVSRLLTRADGIPLRVWIVDNNSPSTVPDVTICLIGRTHLIPSEYRNAIGILILDEADRLCTPTAIPGLLAFVPRYIISATATFERDDGLHHMIHALCGSHGIFLEPTKRFTVARINTLVRTVKMPWSETTRYLASHQERNNLICRLVNACSGRYVLILTALTDHTHTLYDQLTREGKSCDWLCGNKKSYEDAPVLIGTLSKIGVGFDQESLCASYRGIRFSVLIIVASIKKYQLLAQSVGRILRADNPLVLHLVDNDGIVLNHWIKARQWYERRSARIVEIERDTGISEIIKSIEC